MKFLKIALVALPLLYIPTEGRAADCGDKQTEAQARQIYTDAGLTFFLRAEDAELRTIVGDINKGMKKQGNPEVAADHAYIALGQESAAIFAVDHGCVVGATRPLPLELLALMLTADDAVPSPDAPKDSATTPLQPGQKRL